MSDTASTVTVVIPTYNRSAWLGELVEAVLGQTRPPDVVLIADNGSTDDTERVAHAYADDERVRYLRRPANIDLILNQNEALAQVETDYVAIVQDDDRIYRDHLRSTADVLDTHPGVGIVHTSFDLIDERGETISPGIALVEARGPVAVEAGEDFVRGYMTNGWRVCFPSALSRTAALRKVGFLQTNTESGPFLADMLMWMEAALDWDVAYVPRTLAAFRIHAGSRTAEQLPLTPEGHLRSESSADEYLVARRRFVERHRDRLDDPDELLGLAGRAWRADTIEYLSQSTFPDRRRSEVLPALRSAARRDRRMALEPGAWRLAAVALAGRRAARLARRARALVRRGS